MYRLPSSRMVFVDTSDNIDCLEFIVIELLHMNQSDRNRWLYAYKAFIKMFQKEQIYLIFLEHVLKESSSYLILVLHLIFILNMRASDIIAIWHL